MTARKRPTSLVAVPARTRAARGGDDQQGRGARIGPIAASVSQEDARWRGAPAGGEARGGKASQVVSRRPGAHPTWRPAPTERRE